MDDCADSRCSDPGTSACFDLGVNAFDCKCIDGWFGTLCAERGNVTWTVQYVLETGTDKTAYAITIQGVLEDEYNYEIHVEYLEAVDDTSVFAVSMFVDAENGTLVEFPDQKELEQLLDVNPTLSGTLIPVESDVVDGDEDDVGLAESELSLVFIIVLVMIGVVMCSGIIFLKRSRRRTVSQKQYFQSNKYAGKTFALPA
jgi:hypothetical protein